MCITRNLEDRSSKIAMVLAMSVIMMVAAAPTWAGALTTFENGAEGWVGPTGSGGATFIDDTFGNPAPSLRTQFTDFGITFRNSSNPDFVGDYTATTEVNITIDTYTTVLNFFGLPTPREFIVELRDYDNVPAGYPWVSVWTSLGVLNEDNPGWHTWTVTITDTSMTELPGGWGGFGAEDPDTFEPILPDDRTFTDVLAGVDEIAFTTLVPGFFFSTSDYDVAIDNIGVFPVPDDDTTPPSIVHAAGIPGQTRPFSGYIDPRSESSNGVDVDLGVDELTIVFSEPVRDLGGEALTSDAFTVHETGGGTPPSVSGIITGDDQVVIVQLDRPIRVQEWTTLQVVVEDLAGNVIEDLGDLGPDVEEPDRVDIAFLPADTDQSGDVTPFDLLAFRQFVNDVVEPEAGIEEDYVDTNRDETVTPFDLLSYRQLINGTGNATQLWAGQLLFSTQP